MDTEYYHGHYTTMGYIAESVKHLPECNTEYEWRLILGFLYFIFNWKIFSQGQFAQIRIWIKPMS